VTRCNLPDLTPQSSDDDVIEFLTVSVMNLLVSAETFNMKGPFTISLGRNIARLAVKALGNRCTVTDESCDVGPHLMRNQEWVGTLHGVYLVREKE
jgi:hypothetical protein